MADTLSETGRTAVTDWQRRTADSTRIGSERRPRADHSGPTRANRLVTCFEPLEDVAGGVGEVGGEGEALAVDLDGR
jgi:hypothetical protein